MPKQGAFWAPQQRRPAELPGPQFPDVAPHEQALRSHSKNRAAKQALRTESTRQHPPPHRTHTPAPRKTVSRRSVRPVDPARTRPRSQRRPRSARLWPTPASATHGAGFSDQQARRICAEDTGGDHIRVGRRHRTHSSPATTPQCTSSATVITAETRLQAAAHTRRVPESALALALPPCVAPRAQTEHRRLHLQILAPRGENENFPK